MTIKKPVLSLSKGNGLLIIVKSDLVDPKGA
jgi:hypothetical protein